MTADDSAQLVQLVVWVKFGMMSLAIAEGLRGLAALVTALKVGLQLYRFNKTVNRFETGAMMTGAVWSLVDKVISNTMTGPSKKKEKADAPRTDPGPQ